MKHLEYIKTTQTWTCPATGVWKIIAVGGGAGGSASTTGNAGSTTSFGTILSAVGGTVSSISEAGSGGFGGYTGFAYGGAPAVSTSDTSSAPVGNGGAKFCTGIGYGAGGAGKYPGYAGNLEMTIVDLEEGEEIACTIGTGGTANSGDLSNITNGRAGVIVVQYLGNY